MDVSLADVQRLGVHITAEEAVAIVRGFLQDHQVGSPEPPFGPPSLANLRLSGAGTVECASCGATPAVTEIAILLQAMLARTPHIPGGLRYAIARALHEVDAPPFDSLEDFSATLGRYEPAERDLAIRRLVERARAAAGRDGAPPDRRRSRQSADELRRHLRDADRRLYESRMARVVVEPPRRRQAWVAGAVLAAVILAVGAGSAMRSRASTLPAVRPPVVPMTSLLPSGVNPDQIEPVIRTASKPAYPPRPRPPTSTAAHSRVSSAFRFRWLRKLVTVHDDMPHH